MIARLLPLTAVMLIAATLSWPMSGVRAQQPASALDLGALQRDAASRDPRAVQLELLDEQSALRLRNLDVERLPALSIVGRAQYQSDVASLPLVLPGASVPTPSNETYDAYVAAQQRLFDPSIAARRDVERAQLAASQARVRTSLFQIRQSVNDAFFSALLLQANADEISAAITAIDAQRRVAAARVRGGTALPSDAAALEAELLRRRQQVDELAADRAAALAVLGQLTRRAIQPDQPLVVPDLAADVARVRSALDELRARPEFEEFARTRELLEEQAASVDARALPRISAFGRAGYGRPGLNPLGADFDAYWMAGVQLDWAPWSWGATRRDREVLALQREIVATEETAFAESIRRGIARDLATIDRLAQALAADGEIIALRERILRETRLRYEEGVITSAEYVDRESDLLAARLARATHRVQLAQAQARFLTLVGVEVR